MKASFDTVQPSVRVLEDGEKVYIFIAVNGGWTERHFAENEPAVQVWECDYREIVTTKGKIDVDKVKAAPEKFLEWVEPATNTQQETVSELEQQNQTLTKQIAALIDQQSFYEDCIAEMAEVVYA